MRWFLVALVALRVATAWAHAPISKPCRDCHQDTHHGELKADCGSCHTLTAWSPSTFGVAQHAGTRYALDGKHVATPCSGCHPTKTSFLVGGTGCLDCHQGPHGPQKSDCERCHTTGNWRAWKLDHRAWLLAGAHARTACVDCHAGVKEGTHGATAPRACASCHDDVHAGQFGKRGCESCHGSEDWRSTSKHPIALAGKHATLACASCHPATTLRGGAVATRYALGYRACKDCHANPHATTKSDCGGCHGAASWAVLDSAQVDHDRVGYALRGAHRQASCSGCHSASARPEKTCEGCHRDPHAGRMQNPCVECHTTTAWHDTRTLEDHRRTRLPLIGAHAALECTACHKRQAERTWRDAPADCWSCHADDARRLPSHAPLGRQCASCHSVYTWKDAKVLTVDRAAHAQFAIATGAHAVTACAGCHVATHVVRCDGCHVTHPTAVARTTAACLSCHPRGARR